MHKIQKQFIREWDKCYSSFLFSSKTFKAKNLILTGFTYGYVGQPKKIPMYLVGRKSEYGTQQNMGHSFSSYVDQELTSCSKLI